MRIQYYILNVSFEKKSFFFGTYVLYSHEFAFHKSWTMMRHRHDFESWNGDLATFQFLTDIFYSQQKINRFTKKWALRYISERKIGLFGDSSKKNRLFKKKNKRLDGKTKHCSHKIRDKMETVKQVLSLKMVWAEGVSNCFAFISFSLEFVIKLLRSEIEPKRKKNN